MLKYLGGQKYVPIDACGEPIWDEAKDGHLGSFVSSSEDRQVS